MNMNEEFSNTYTDIYPQNLTACYELIECLSNKEWNETLLARDRRNGGLVVVKCYEKGHPCYEESEPKQIRELSFPGIPAYIAEYSNENMRCVVREYIEGESLAECGGKLTKRQVCKIGLELGEILKYLHGQNPPVIHRDIKHQNVIIQRDGSAALIDFGISRCYKDEQTSDTLYGGTQCFAPPEQYGFAQTDCRSDIYSLGILMSWLYTGTAAPVKNPTSAFERVLSKCTAFDPEQRFRNVDVMEKRLISAVSSEDRLRRTVYGMSAAIAVLAVAFIVTGVMLFRKYVAGGSNGEPDVIVEHNNGDIIANAGGVNRDVTLGVDGDIGDGKLLVVKETHKTDENTYADEPSAEANTKAEDATSGEAETTGKIGGQCGSKVYWELDFDTETLTLSGMGAVWRYDYDEHSSIYGRGERPWFKYRDYFTKVVVEPGILELSNGCFNCCRRLREVDLGEVKIIGQNCFSECDLQEVTFPDNLELINSWAFANNPDLTEIDIPKKVRAVGNSAFSGCFSLEKVIFHGTPDIWRAPNSVGSILCDDSGMNAADNAVFYCRDYGKPIEHAIEFGIPYVITED